MKIIQIIPGSGGSFYCGNCMRDSKYIHALRSQGLEVVIVPMYLPLFPKEENTQPVPIFYGAVNLYLKQLFPWFEKAPNWVVKALNSKRMLSFAAKMANSTRATGLEEMTISMLQGENGRQREELEHLVNWLKHHYKPDVIHISNALLLGLVHSLKKELNVPVVCTLQDEDVWVDVMSEATRDFTWKLMQEKAKEVDLFISVSRYFTEYMRTQLALPEEQVATLHLGVDPADYTYKPASEKQPSVGFLSRLCDENGLGILVDAYILLKQMPGNELVRLYLTGGQTADDTHFIDEQRKKWTKAGLAESVELLEKFDSADRQAFFDKVSVLSVPVKKGEAFGIYLTEAMAAGIPIVQPALGAFPEIVEASQGGVIYSPNTPEALAKALSDVFGDSSTLEQLGKNACESVKTAFNIHVLAGKMADLYKKTIQSFK